MRWTGLGCLSLVLWLPAVGVALAIAGDGDVVPGIAIVLGFVAGGVVNWLLGTWLNSGPGLPTHTVGTTASTVPMESATVAYVVLASVFAANVVGRQTSPVLGWLAFGVILVALAAAAAAYRGRRRQARRLAALADRAELARARGWRYEAKVPDLAQRWKALVGWRAYSITALGVVGGECDGLPFTAFDSETGLDGRTDESTCTTWAVHLPVAYPRLSTTVPAASAILPGLPVGPEAARLFDGTMDGPLELGDLVPEPRAVTPDEIEAETELPGFAQALMTSEVRRATLAHRLTGWRIEGRDVIFVSARRATPLAAPEVVDTAERLVALVRLFPADLAERYGAAPTTDIPLAVGVA